MSSRPALAGSEAHQPHQHHLHHQEAQSHHPHHPHHHHHYNNKAELAKSKSMDGSRFRPGGGGGGGLRMGSGGGDWSASTGSTATAGSAGAGGLELGCLNNYGLGGLIHSAPPPPGPWNTLVPPPAEPAANNAHRRLERQLTINPAFDPRINKPRFSKTSPEILSSAAMEYMHRTPPPPLGVPPAEVAAAADFQHTNVTRIASAPDSIRQWGTAGGGGSAANALPVAVVEPLGPPSPAATPLQRNNSSSDTNLNRTVSADPFMAGSAAGNGDAWNYKFDSGLSPILGSSATGQAGSSIWGPLPPAAGGTATSALDTPPLSPGQSGLGPVGSRPAKEASRLELKYHLSALFPAGQVEKVMSLLPDEQDPKKLCAAIMKMNPVTTSI